MREQPAEQHDPAWVEGPRVPYDRTRTVIHLFEACAAAAPARTAVIFGSRSIAFGELDAMANGLAASLAANGIGRGDLVPLLVGNTAMAPLAMLAIMKVGAGFVPLDENWPAARLESILALLDAKRVLASPELASHAGLGRTRVMRIDDASLSWPARCPVAALPGADDLAYGFFTSGSTGLPKCALNRHLGLLNRLLTMSRRFADDGAVVLQNSRHVFDSSLWQLLWPLSTGNTVVVPVRDGILDLQETVSTIERHGVTMTDFVPSVLKALVDLLEAVPQEAARLASLRRVLVGGETITARMVQAFRRVLPRVMLTNTYGPTECSIGSVWHEIVEPGDPIPIGQPIDNTSVLVLGEDGEPCEPMTVGELCLGGDCVGLGYLGDPAATRAAFVTHAFSQENPTIYRTGDLGFARPDGLLFFVGRRDRQVKLGGVRVDPSEIERALAADPRVADARLVVLEEGERKRLVAFVVPAGGPVDLDAIVQHARARLPASWMPSSVLPLDDLPLTANGKVDLHALSERAREELGRRVRVAPRTERERAIHRVWSVFLDDPAIGVTDDLLDRGGDSLLACRLGLALRPVFGRALDPRAILSNPTIERLALAEPKASRPVTIAEDLAADLRLPPDIGCSAPAGDPRTVLLTGATGFIGAHLVAALLRRGCARIVCLVRAVDAQAARLRLTDALRRYELGPDAAAAHLDVIVGDAARPRLGLDPDTFEVLATEIESVVVGAAMVNLLRDYAAHRPANVLGMIELLRLASRGKPKHVHFLSTLGVVAPPDGSSGIVTEAALPSPDLIPPDGYSRSKWVAEGLLGLAAQRGVGTTVYRLGEVGPASRTGIGNGRGLVDILSRASMALGLCCESPLAVDFTPVDDIAEVIAATVLHGERPPRLHLLQPVALPLDALFAVLRTRTGLRPVPYAAFRNRLQDVLLAQDDGCASHDLLRLHALLPEPTGDAAADVCRLASILTPTSGRFSAEIGERLRRAAGVVYPHPADLAARYAARLASAAAP